MLIPNLSVLLAERRLTISRLAQDTGISRTTLTALTTRSAKGIQFDTLNRLCGYLKVTPDALFIYRPFDLTVACDGLPGRSTVAFTVTDAAGVAQRLEMTCDAEFLRDASGALAALRVRLTLPDTPGAVRLSALLQGLPASVLSDLERDILAAFDRRIAPALAPFDYTPDLRWPWQAHL